MSARQINAAVLHGIGETPRYERFPAPVPGAGDEVVAVTAAALKPSDRWMAKGVHYAPTTFPVVVGLDGVGRLSDGTRVAFFAPQRPYGGMGEQALVRRDMWFPIPDGVDDVTAAAVLNPGAAAWKTLVWEGEVAAGQTVLVLGATGTSGRIASRLAIGQGAAVIVAGRNRSVLDQLTAAGAQAAIDVGLGHEELTAAIAALGPYDLIIDYLWGEPAEAVFAALARVGARQGTAKRRTRYVQVGITAGEVAAMPAVALRTAGLELTGSGAGGPAPFDQAAAAYGALLQQVAAGEITVDIAPVPLREVEQSWPQTGDRRRIVFVP